MRQPITLPQVSDSKPRGELRRVAQLLSISPEIVAAIIAQGVLSDTSTLVDSTIELVSDPKSKYTYRRLAAFAARLSEQLVTRDVPTLEGDDVDTDLMDVVFNYALHYGESGYLVGLAVGLALGSGHPFAGGIAATASRR